MAKEDVLAYLSPVLPADFFEIEADIPFLESISQLAKKKDRYLLPDTSFLFAEERFAEIALFGAPEGLFVYLEVNNPFEKAVFPEVRDGDSVELFIDTRNLKTTGFATRFCHHFVFLPKPVNGISCQELTRFRSEDVHEIAEILAVTLDTEFSKKGYKMEFFLPKEYLFGYDPGSFFEMGFTYRINRYKGAPQHFSVSSSYFSLEQQPSLWASLHFKKD